VFCFPCWLLCHGWCLPGNCFSWLVRMREESFGNQGKRACCIHQRAARKSSMVRFCLWPCRNLFCSIILAKYMPSDHNAQEMKRLKHKENFPDRAGGLRCKKSRHCGSVCCNIFRQWWPCPRSRVGQLDGPFHEDFVPSAVSCPVAAATFTEPVRLTACMPRQPR
jgi:hypothetical protein